MSTNSSELDTCPTAPGLSREGGFNPGLSWSSLAADPTGNWHVIGWLVCLGFLVVTWLVAFKTVYDHLRNYYEPQIQRHKLRVIMFPPVYATLSWFEYLRYDYATTINFFATLFEAFAVFNLYICLQAYLKPYREEAGTLKEEKDTKIMFVYNLHLKSKWGMHYRTLTDILVFQYPIWSMFDSFISIFAELKGRFCEGVYSFKGAYVYLTIIDFISLSIILGALFTYLDVFHNEWKRGHIRAHGMFWCVKGPIMVNFYLGQILLTILSTAGVIKGTDGSHGSIAWPADAVKNGLHVIIVCVVMMVDSIMMNRFFGPQDNIQSAASVGQTKRMSGWKAFVDGYLAYIPEFFYMTACCGADSFKLIKKRRELKKRKDGQQLNGGGTDHLLNEQTEYKMTDINQNIPHSYASTHTSSQHDSMNFTSPYDQPRMEHINPSSSVPYSQGPVAFPEPQQPGSYRPN
ncbi:organic solute transporter Ostalpha-domain-containing protein [Blakeslea trispora]|nr:organic solute transporter Ostalpha-domain-containing protein [Blakeslea trispora]